MWEARRPFLTLSFFSWACCWNFLKLFSVDSELVIGEEAARGEPADELKLAHEGGWRTAFPSCKKNYRAQFNSIH